MKNDVFSQALSMLDECPCKDGCPSCIGPDAGADAKVLTRRLLLNILEQTPSNEEV